MAICVTLQVSDQVLVVLILIRLLDILKILMSTLPICSNQTVRQFFSLNIDVNQRMFD